MALLRILMPGDLRKLSGTIGEEVEVTFASLKGMLSTRGYRDAGPGTTPGYRVWRKDINDTATPADHAGSA